MQRKNFSSDMSIQGGYNLLDVQNILMEKGALYKKLYHLGWVVLTKSSLLLLPPLSEDVEQTHIFSYKHSSSDPIKVFFKQSLTKKI